VKETIKAWLKKAQTDLKHARASYKINDFDWAGLAAQQSAEKALKALCMYKGHDLTTLGRKVDAPIEVLENCGMLTPFYTASRYPDVDEIFNDEQNKKAAKDSINAAEIVIRWCKSKIRT